MPSLTFAVNEQVDGNLQVHVKMSACICSKRENDMIDLILRAFAKESGQTFKSLGIIEDKSFTIPVHKG